MDSKSVVADKSFAFAVRIVKLYKYLCDEKKEYVLSKQLLRSGTSIGANIQEGLNGQSKRDFLMKMNISLKEASETQYWLRLLTATTQTVTYTAAQQTTDFGSPQSSINVKVYQISSTVGRGFPVSGAL